MASRRADAIGRLARIRHIALDLDGTIYKDGDPFPTTGPFLNLLDELGIGHTFLTNNCSRSTEDYVAHLRKIGIGASRDDIYTSADAMVDFLRREQPAIERLCVLGTASLKDHFARFGFAICDDATEPDAVVVGFDTTLSYGRLCRTAYWIARDKPYFATHPDRVCPTKEETVLVDCGSICAALRAATGREPLAVPGKPNPRMLEGIMERHRVAPAQLAMVGDRLYTDMIMAQRSGALAVLVLTGEATAEEANALPNPPDLVLGDLSELGDLLNQNWRLDRAEPLSGQRPATAGR